MQVNSEKTAMKNIQIAMCRAAASGGEPSFNSVKAAFNAFIDTFAATAQGIVAVAEPVLNLDKFIVDTFVKPPLEATVSVLEGSVKKINIPMQTLAGLDTTGKNGKYYARLQGGADKISSYLTRDFTRLLNKRNELYEWVDDQSEFLQDLKLVATTIQQLKVQESYQEFIQDICPTISQ